MRQAYNKPVKIYNVSIVRNCLGRRQTSGWQSVTCGCRNMEKKKIGADKLHRSNKLRKSTEIKSNLNSLEIKWRKAVECERQ